MYILSRHDPPVHLCIFYIHWRILHSLTNQNVPPIRHVQHDHTKHARFIRWNHTLSISIIHLPAICKASNAFVHILRPGFGRQWKFPLVKWKPWLHKVQAGLELLNWLRYVYLHRGQSNRYSWFYLKSTQANPCLFILFQSDTLKRQPAKHVAKHVQNMSVFPLLVSNSQPPSFTWSW